MFLKLIAISLQILMTVNCQQFKCRYLDEQEISLQETTQNTLERLRRIRQDLQALTDDIIALEQSLNSTNSSAFTNSSATPVSEQIEKDEVLNITVGDFRLADVEYIRGSYVRGRAEYYLSWAGTWGTVCGDDFTEQNADVFCKSIGFSSPLSFLTSQDLNSQAQYQKWAVPSDYPIKQINVNCNGTEDSLLNCYHTQPNYCGHSRDVIISCKTNQILPSGINITEGNLRLQNISSQNGNIQGLLLVKDSNKWQTVCYDMQNNFAAKLLCQEMNLPFTNASFASIYTSFQFYNWHVTNQTSILSYNFNCNEQSTQLEQCTKFPIQYCIPVQSIILTCDGQPVNDSVNDFSQHQNQNIRVGKFQLAQVEYDSFGGVTGRAEFFDETTQQWGTICDDFWEQGGMNQRIFCGSLNLPKNNPSFSSFSQSNSEYLQKWQISSGQINMDDVNCFGTESSLENCRYTSQHNCGHAEDVIVTCK